jgi:20S proteasome subunit beta 1
LAFSFANSSHYRPQAVADIVHYHAQFYASQHNARPPVHTIASLFQSLCYENKDRLSAGIIVAGWDEEQGGQVYNIPLGGGIFRQPWSIGGEFGICKNSVEYFSSCSVLLY